MSLQPGTPAFPAAVAASTDRELDDDAADTVRETPRTERDLVDGEPVGRSDRDADVAGTDPEPAQERWLNEDALDAYLARDRESGERE